MKGENCAEKLIGGREGERVSFRNAPIKLYCYGIFSRLTRTAFRLDLFLVFCALFQKVIFDQPIDQERERDREGGGEGEREREGEERRKVRKRGGRKIEGFFQKREC